MGLPFEFDQFERRMAERHVAILTVLNEIKKKRESDDARLRAVERQVTILMYAYSVGLLMLGALAYKFGWGQG